MKYYLLKKGQSLVELLLAISLLAVFIPALLTGIVSSREGKIQQNQRSEATSLFQEAYNATRSVREKGWSTFAVNGIFHPIISGSSWTLLPGAETINDFTRQIVISDVYRDANGTIVTTGGSLDPSTKKIILTINWNIPYASSLQNTFYLTRYLDNLTFTQTTENDFKAGTLIETTVTNNNGGEVTLGSGGQANWCSPQDAIRNTVTLPKQGNSITAKEGAAYIGTGDGSTGATFVNIGINNPAQPTPPAASIVGTYESSYKTNAVFSDGTYAYLATDNGSEQVIILNISTSPPYSKIGSVTISGGNPANGIYVVGNILYVTSGNKLYTYDITDKNGGHTSPLGSTSMWFSIGNQPTARQVVVNGSYAYVGTGNTLFGLQKFIIRNGGQTIQVVGVSNFTWNQQSQGLAVNSSGTRAYVAFNQGSGYFSKGFFIVDTSSIPPSWRWGWLPYLYDIKGTYNTGATDPRGMALGTGNRAIVVGVGGAEQYIVIDITIENNPVRCGGLAVTSGVYGVSSVLEGDGDAYSYIITGEARDQFKIIQGGNGGRYTSSGTFESSTLDTNYSTAFNRLTATINQPSQTNIQLQVAVAPPISGSCNGITYTFIGPNAAPSAYFIPNGNIITAPIPITSVSPNYQNPARCFRYKVYFSTTDPNQTPVFNDITVNYSP